MGNRLYFLRQHKLAQTDKCTSTLPFDASTLRQAQGDNQTLLKCCHIDPSTGSG